MLWRVKAIFIRMGDLHALYRVDIALEAYVFCISSVEFITL